MLQPETPGISTVPCSLRLQLGVEELLEPGRLGGLGRGQRVEPVGDLAEPLGLCRLGHGGVALGGVIVLAGQGRSQVVGGVGGVWIAAGLVLLALSAGFSLLWFQRLP